MQAHLFPPQIKRKADQPNNFITAELIEGKCTLKIYSQLILLISLVIILLQLGCKSPTGPGGNIFMLPGRRDYTWTRDTLRADEFGFQLLSGIWGANPNDVWVIGDAATYVNKVWHYDGYKWKNYLLDQFATPVRIYGVSNSEIWMVTTISDIWRYDGIKWFKDTTIVPAGYQRILFEDIYGYKNNLYAVGIAEKADGDYTGIVVHYDGNNWKILNTAQIKEYFLQIMFLEGGDILISGQNYYEPNIPCRLYKLSDSTFTLIKKSTLDFRLGILSNKMYINTERRVYKYNDGTLTEILNLINTDYAGSLWGRTINDFFSANYGWNLGHYNGTNMINIYHPDSYIIDGQIFEKDVFFICYTLDNVNYILRGRLK